MHRTFYERKFQAEKGTISKSLFQHVSFVVDVVVVVGGAVVVVVVVVVADSSGVGAGVKLSVVFSTQKIQGDFHNWIILSKEKILPTSRWYGTKLSIQHNVSLVRFPWLNLINQGDSYFEHLFNTFVKQLYNSKVLD